MTGKQDWRTPPEFIAAVEKWLGPIDFDLAATTGHEVTRRGDVIGAHFSPGTDSLAQSWELPGVTLAWLNPPFANIRPWAAKCAESRDLNRLTLMLVPASMGSLWWSDHVLGKCLAIGVTRMKFAGAEDPYPKDLALCVYGDGMSGSGFWAWQKADAPTIYPFKDAP